MNFQADVKMLLRFGSHPAAWFAVLSVPFVASALVTGAASLYLYASTSQGQAFPIVAPAATVLFVFAASHLLFLGMFAELVVKTGGYRETDPLVVDTLGGGESL